MTIKPIRVAVSKGHNVYNNSVFDNGAIGSGKKEAYEVDKTVDILIPMLRSQGHYVVDVTPKNEHFKSSKEAHIKRAQNVNKGKFDIYLDVHLNAGGGTGSEMWVYAPRGLSYDYARDILNNIVSDTGLRNRGVKVKPTMWSLSMTNCPSIIIEGGFIDSKTDMDIITPELYAKSIAKAFGEVPGDVKPTDEIYRVRKSWEDIKSQMGAYSKLDNAITLAKQLNLTAYDSKGEQVYPEKEVLELLIYTRLIKSGVRGDDVKLLQTYLNKLGFNSGVSDGIAGVNTDKAIKSFQKQYGLTIDGLAGRATISKINELIQGNSNKPNPPKETTKSQRYYKSGNTHVVELDPMDLKISVQDKPGNKIGLSNFVTSGFQWHHANGFTYALGILASDNKGISDRQPHNKPAGTLLVHRDGSVAIKDIADLSKESMVRFAVSGCSILPTVKMTSAGFVGAYSDIGRRTNRPMIGYRKKDNKIIIAVDNCSINVGSNIMKKLGCDEAITLDAGGSTTLKVDNKTIVSTTRRLHSVITW